MALRSFLSHSAVALKRSKGATICVGNEACDADSIISSIAYAYHLAIKSGVHTAQEAYTGPANESAYVPVITVRRDEIELRREAMWILESALSVESASQPASSLRPWKADLVCLDDLTSGELKPFAAALARDGSLHVTLMDHNAMKGPLCQVVQGDAVSAIVDHHMDTGSHPQVQGKRRRISFDPSTQRGIGSTCSLVASRMLGWEADDEDESGSFPCTLCPSVAHALLGVILIDTVGLDPRAGKVTAEDERAVSGLCEYLVRVQGEAGRVDTAALFTKLQALKFDPEWWAAMPVEQALGYDFKSFQCGAPSFPSALTFGTSAILRDLSELLGQNGPERGETLDAAARFCKQQDLDFLLLMSMTCGSSIRRQLAVICPPGSPAHVMEAIRTMRTQLDSTESGLDLIESQPAAQMGTSTSAALVLYNQGNVKASRKQIVPLVLASLTPRL